MSRQNSAQRGARGEKLAAAYYRKKGYTVLEQNYRTRQGEIDLIVRKAQTIVFAEVKTREPDAIARPGEFVTAEKQKRLILAAKGYLMHHREAAECFLRFDVVEITMTKWGRTQLNCIENAFTL